jgi:CRP/FNR family transcriptional regulator, polysaccharide utilization system transcription regulator
VAVTTPFKGATYFETDMIDDQLASVEKVERWPAGTALFHEGEEPRGVYVVHSGEVELAFSGANGAHKTFRIAVKDDVVGLGDAVSKRHHECTATTCTAARIGFIPIDDLQQALADRPALWLSVARLLCADVNACWDSMRRMKTSRVGAIEN